MLLLTVNPPSDPVNSSSFTFAMQALPFSYSSSEFAYANTQVLQPPDYIGVLLYCSLLKHFRPLLSCPNYVETSLSLRSDALELLH